VPRKRKSQSVLRSQNVLRNPNAPKSLRNPNALTSQKSQNVRANRADLKPDWQDQLRPAV
jgi:hypothetical protein